jgi:hypothetical protein
VPSTVGGRRRLSSVVMMNKIDKIKKIADIKIEKRGKKWLVN